MGRNRTLVSCLNAFSQLRVSELALVAPFAHHITLRAPGLEPREVAISARALCLLEQEWLKAASQYRQGKGEPSSSSLRGRPRTNRERGGEGEERQGRLLRRRDAATNDGGGADERRQRRPRARSQYGQTRSPYGSPGEEQEHPQGQPQQQLGTQRAHMDAEEYRTGRYFYSDAFAALHARALRLVPELKAQDMVMLCHAFSRRRDLEEKEAMADYFFALESRLLQGQSGEEGEGEARGGDSNAHAHHSLPLPSEEKEGGRDAGERSSRGAGLGADGSGQNRLRVSLSPRELALVVASFSFAKVPADRLFEWAAGVLREHWGMGLSSPSDSRFVFPRLSLENHTM